MKYLSSSHKVVLTLFTLLLLLSPLSATGSKEEAPKQPADTLMEGELDTSGVQSVQTNTAQSAPAVDGAAQFLTLDIYGNEISQDIFAQADITMLNVWGTYCSPCINEMPGLGEINREYADKGFQITGIVIDGYSSDEEKFREQLGMARAIEEYTKADYTHLLPVSYEMNNLYLKDIQVVPTTFFLDSKGKIIGDAIEGSRSKEDWIAIIDEVMNEYAN